MSVFILMILNLSGPQTGQPVATAAFSDLQNCVKQSQAFNGLSVPHAYSWCAEKKPDGNISPVVLPQGPSSGRCSAEDIAALAEAELARRGVKTSPQPTGPDRTARQ